MILRPEDGAAHRAAREAAIVVRRDDRAVVRVFGRDPVRMIQGLVTNDVAAAPAGRAVYAAMLTPKGKMIADLRVVREPGGDLLLELDAAALPGVLAHLRKFVPPLFARFEEASESYAVIGVYGPEARALLERVLGVAALGEAQDALHRVERDDDALRVIATGYAGVPGWDILLPVESANALFAQLTAAGAAPADLATLEVLRIEAGQPRWGAELNDGVIPLEAGLRERAISETKGCYTGQEVIIRILHRGHVNRLLRRLRFSEAEPPEAGAQLVRPEDGRPVGTVTSACLPPGARQAVGLAYVRREVEPPARLRLGSGTQEVEVR